MLNPHVYLVLSLLQTAVPWHNQDQKAKEANINADSWVELDSRPSSSSLSSATEEIITTGLRVQHGSSARRRRRVRGAGQFQVGYTHQTANTGDGSSQEEYEESESESDRVLTSTNEAIGPSPLQYEVRRSSQTPYYITSASESASEQDGDDEDDDENATAVNYPRSTNRNFEPRPNAFTHPSGYGTGRSFEQSYPPRRPGARQSAQRHSYPQHTPYSAISPSYQADHDEALRASLSTLLSAAAAVRGLPKPGQPTAHRSNGVSNRIEPSTLRIVSESVALGDRTGATTGTDPSAAVSSRTTATTTTTTTTENSDVDKSKRKVAAGTHVRSSSKDRKTIKKARKTGPSLDEVSPTLFTWLVSAGVVVLVSALSFSAGYVVGHKAGQAEAVGQLGSAGSDATRCGKEVASEVGRTGLGLRRLRWSAASGVRV